MLSAKLCSGCHRRPLLWRANRCVRGGLRCVLCPAHHESCTVQVTEAGVGPPGGFPAASLTLSALKVFTYSNEHSHLENQQQSIAFSHNRHNVLNHTVLGEDGSHFELWQFKFQLLLKPLR